MLCIKLIGQTPREHRFMTGGSPFITTDYRPTSL